jgi:hypothetical protein
MLVEFSVTFAPKKWVGDRLPREHVESSIGFVLAGQLMLAAITKDYASISSG